MIKHKHTDNNAFKIFVDENKSKFKRKYKNDEEIIVSIQQIWNKMRKSCTDEYFYYIQKYKEQCYSDIIFMKKPCQETSQIDQSELLAQKIRNNWATINNVT